MKTHYQALGINEDADDEVIVAAYKALAKKYHPDTYSGDKKFAEERMKEINIAYGVLSDKAKRKKYDEEVKSNKKSNEYNDEDEFDGAETGEGALQEDWEILTQVYPEAEYARQYLYRISPTLSFSYQIFILTTKNGPISNPVAIDMEAAFLEKYFGYNSEIKKIAKACLVEKNRKLAKDINKKISLLGSAAEKQILFDLRERYSSEIKTFSESSFLNLKNYIKIKNIEKTRNEKHNADERKRKEEQAAEQKFQDALRKRREEERKRREEEKREKVKKKQVEKDRKWAEFKAKEREKEIRKKDVLNLSKYVPVILLSPVVFVIIIILVIMGLFY